MDILFFTASLLALLATASAHITRKAQRLNFGVMTVWDALVTIEMWHVVILSQMVFASALWVGSGFATSALFLVGWAFWIGSWGWAAALVPDMKRTRTVIFEALKSALGPTFIEEIPSARRVHLRNTTRLRDWVAPVRLDWPGIEILRNVKYGDKHKRQVLDIYRPDLASDKTATEPLPVLLHIHGGAWTIGKKSEQARPLLRLLARRGWVCATINYGRSPKHRFPDHLHDARDALRWVKQNIAQYGGDPSFVAVSGGSAGGHLSALLALTSGLRSLDPLVREILGDPDAEPSDDLHLTNAESADPTDPKPTSTEATDDPEASPVEPTGSGDVLNLDPDLSVQACVPFYGKYDMLHRDDPLAHKIVKTLSGWVLPSTPEEAPEAWALASPIDMVHRLSVPTFVIHGEGDELIPVGEAYAFYAAAADHTDHALALAVLPGANHAFDVVHSIRTEAANDGAHAFLEWCYAQHLRQPASSSGDAT